MGEPFRTPAHIPGMKHLMLLLLAGTLAAATHSGSGTAVVTIKNDAFTPTKITIAAGTTVTFVNLDDDAHTVTSPAGTFDSKGMDTGAVWKRTFTTPGVYTYFCELHPFMKGTIVVKAVHQ